MCKGSKNCCEKKDRKDQAILKGQDGIFWYITEFYGYKTMCHHPFLQHSAVKKMYVYFSNFKVTEYVYNTAFFFTGMLEFKDVLI